MRRPVVASALDAFYFVISDRAPGDTHMKPRAEDISLDKSKSRITD
jgi:hypothetical protein